MDTNITDAIDAAVFAQREQEHLFTAYDITTIVRRDGHWLEHSACRDYVRRMFENNEMTSYDQSLVTLDTGNQAYVYHPALSNPETYVSEYTNVKAQDSSGGATHPTGYFPQQNSVAPSNSTVTRTFNGKKTLDKKQRLLVPAQLLREGGFKPFRTAYVSINSDGTIVISETDKDGSKMRLIDNYCNLRIGLKKAGVTASVYTFSAVPSEVTAIPA